MTDESQLSILVVDTNPETLFSLANELGRCGYRVLAANGVDEAIAIGESNAFEILLCKLPMQPTADLSAAHLLNYFRRCKHLRQLRLIAMSSTQLAGVRLRHRNGETAYSIRSNIGAAAISGVIRQTMFMPADYSRSDIGVYAPNTHFRAESFAKR